MDAYSKPLTFAKADIETDVPPKVLDQLIKRTETTFEALASEEPHWAVLTRDEYKSVNISDKMDDFYASGVNQTMILSSFAERSDIDLSKFSSCLELGCGVGRVTVWLAKLFPQMIAVDISAEMLRIAQERASEMRISGVEFIRLRSRDTLAQIQDFDVFLSYIVFQHNTPPVQLFMLKTILERMNPGGVALFQMITGRLGYRFNAEEYLLIKPDQHLPEMHAVPQRAIYETLKQVGVNLLEVREDGACGPTPDMISNTFFVRK